MDTNRALQVLQIQSNASLDDLKKAYRRIVKKCHPDKFSDLKEKSEAEDQIKEVNEAYTLLKYAWERKSDSHESVSEVFNSDSIFVTSTSKGYEFFYERAKQRENNGQDLEALQDCTQAIRLNSDYLEAYQLRRLICLKLGYENRARSDDKNIERLQQKPNKSKRGGDPVEKCDDVLENNYYSPNTPPPAPHKPTVQPSSKNPRQSETYNYSIDDYSTDSDNTSDPSVFYKRAQRKLKLGREQEAIEDCKQAIHLKADYVEAYRLRRMIYLRLGQQAEAALDTQEICRLEQPDQFKSKKSGMSHPNSVEPEVMTSNDSEAFYDLAIQNFQQGQHQKAITNCNRAIRLNPDYLEAYKLRRKICLLLGHKDRVTFDTKQISRLESNIAESTQENS